MRILLFGLVLYLIPAAQAQLTPPAPKPIVGARQPALSPDGKRLAFVYRGDIWLTNSKGGRARPLTFHLEYDAYPVFSPDGHWIAFGSKRHGGWDIFVIPAEGGKARRLTWHSGHEIPFGWSPDGQQIAFGARRDSPNYCLMSVEVATYKSKVLVEDYAALRYPRWSPDGNTLLYTRYGMPWYRPRYRGAAAAQTWSIDLKTGKRQRILGDDRQYLFAQYMPNGQDVLVSTTGEPTPTLAKLNETLGPFDDNDQRAPNLWLLDRETELKQITFFKTDSVRYPSIAAESGTIAFEHGADIWLMRSTRDKPHPVKLVASTDEKRNSKEHKTSTTGVTEAEPSPKGDVMLFGLQGDIWTIKTTKAKGVNRERDELAMRHTTWAGDDSDFSWANDGKKFYFTSDREGNTRIYEYDLEKRTQTPLWNRDENIVRLRVSPDGKHLYFWVAGPEGGLHRMTLANQEVKRIFKLPGIHMRGRGGIDYEWSPDLKWIAYTTRTGNNSYNIWVIPADGGEAKNVTRLSAFHSQPTWSPNGKYLYFQSDRDGSGLYRVALEPDEFRNTDIDDRYVKPDKTPDVKIDFDQIDKRIQKISSTSPSSDVTMTNSGFLFFLSGGDVYRAAHNGSEVKKINSDGGRSALRVFPSGRSASFIKSSRMYLMKLDNGSATPVTFKAHYIRDTLAQRTAALYQFWKTYHHRFYDNNFHGRNWSALRDKYLQRLTSVDTHDEFAVLLQMMVGELDASHTEVSPASSGITAQSTPHIGFTFDTSHQGIGLKIKNVPPRAPGSFEKTRLKPGEFILSIDGQKVSTTETLYQFLNGKKTRFTEFVVNDKPSEQGARKVRYKLLSSSEWQKIQYNNNVTDLQQRVEKSSKGRIGYLHIPAMGSADQARFEREAYEYMLGKDAMIFDVRFNRGGNISDTLIDWLERKPHGIYKSRDREPEIAPSRAWEKPVVVLMNEHSYSNGEMFPYAMRQRKLAQLVGMPTPGYVIWTSTFSLTDGTKARIPGRGVFRMDGTNMENQGEKPDVQIWVTPEEWLEGKDPQLEQALKLLEPQPANATP